MDAIGTTFTRIVDRYGGDRRVRTPCAEQYRSMDHFAQLTYGKACATSRPASRSTHRNSITMGFRQPVRRSLTLADAIERRDWRIHAALAQRLIPDEDAVRRKNWGWTSSTPWTRRPSPVPVGLSVGALPAPPMAASEDAHGPEHSEFYRTSRIKPNASRRSCPRICSCRKPEPSTSWIVATSTLPAHYGCSKPGPSERHACQAAIDAIASIRRRRIARPASFATWYHLPGSASTPGLPRTSAAHPLQAPPARRWSGITATTGIASGRHHLRALQKSHPELFFKWIKQASSNAHPVHGTSERRRSGLPSRLRPRRHRQEAPRPGRLETLCYRSSR